MIVDCAVYANGKRLPGPFTPEAAHARVGDEGSFVWLGLYEPTEEEFAAVEELYQLPELAVEDAIHAHQRPKLEAYGDMLFVVLKTARYIDPEEIVELGEILMFVGPTHVIAVRHGEGTPLTQTRASIESDPELLELGPSAVLYAVMDRVVDDYQPAIEGLDNDIQQVEEQVFSEVGANPIERIYRLKREVLEFSRAIVPLEEPLDRLASGRYRTVHPEVWHSFRDVADHLTRASERIHTFRELLTSILEANLAQVGIKQNEDMRKISGWVAIIAGPAAIAGFYGMNFRDLPLLASPWGLPVVVLVMAATSLVVYWAFRRSGWL